MNVSADQIEKLMAERRAAERAEVHRVGLPRGGGRPTVWRRGRIWLISWWGWWRPSAFADFAPGLHPFDWLVGILGGGRGHPPAESDATVKRAMLELEQEGLLERKRQGHCRPKLLYVLV